MFDHITAVTPSCIHRMALLRRVVHAHDHLLLRWRICVPTKVEFANSLIALNREVAKKRQPAFRILESEVRS